MKSEMSPIRSAVLANHTYRDIGVVGAAVYLCFNFYGTYFIN